MNRIIEQRRKELTELCIKYKVLRLELFGSAATAEEFRDKESDLDFLLEFQNLPGGEYADSYFNLLDELQTLFQRHVDLVMAKAITNPYFLESIQKSRIPLYAA